MVFFGVNFTELCCCRHSIIISGSQSKIEKNQLFMVVFIFDRDREIIMKLRLKMKKTMKSWFFFSIFDCDPEIIMECLQQQSSVNFTPKKTMINFFSRKKKLCIRHLQNGRFGDIETEPETTFGNRKFFFQWI